MNDRQSPDIEHLGRELEEAKAKQVYEVNHATEELAEIKIKGKKTDRQLEEAKALGAAQPLVEKIQTAQADLMEEASKHYSKPGVQEKLHTSAEQMMNEEKADKLRVELNKELAMLSRNLMEEVAGLNFAFEKLRENFEMLEDQLKQQLLQERISQDVTAGILWELNIDPGNAFQDNETGLKGLGVRLREFKNDLGFLSGGKKKKVDQALAELAKLEDDRKVRAQLKTQRDSVRAEVYDGKWEGWKALKEHMQEAIQVSADQQEQIDIASGQKAGYGGNGQKYILLRPLEFEADKNQNQSSVFYAQLKEILRNI
ncbi:MAG: hypothetical protein JWO40_290 [Candidatus Doudnabacteria bacterium]|nr:hypothetical protein [Candidatus Doudnabacteria bacterium]